jgi:hypothetical protein
MTLVALRIPQQGIYVDHGEGPVSFIGDLYILDLPLVAEQLVGVEQFLPRLSGSYLPHSRAHSIGSCDREVLGQG